MSVDQFKFRVWHNVEKRYLTNNVKARYVIDNNGNIYHYSAFGKLSPEKEVVLERCTGLKDKNGKLIYEGDVLRFASQIDICVTFRKGGFVYSLTEDERIAYRLTEVIAKETQIIGNIHNGQFREVTKMIGTSMSPATEGAEE